MELTRRDFMRLGGQTALAAGMLSSAEIVEAALFRKKTFEETLGPGNYTKLTKDWDPIYGPKLGYDQAYGCIGTFDCHKNGRVGNIFPGVDYDVPKGTPLVPPGMGFITSKFMDNKRALGMHMVSATTSKYVFGLGHVDDWFVGDEFIVTLGMLKSGIIGRMLTENEIVAVSGDTGTSYPHLHFNVIYQGEYVDAEKLGFDGRKPVFSDGEAILTPSINYRIPRLEKKLEGLEEELKSWPEELSELKGRLAEHYKFMGDAKGQQVVDNPHFQDMRALLKVCTLETKKFVPGSKPYSLMLAIVGYSMVPPYSNQEVILTLPFIAPGVVQKYRKVDYKEGPFYQLRDGKFVQVKE